MMVLTIDHSPIKLRGELTKWLMEIKPGMFVGRVSAMVRQKLWERVCETDGVAGAVLIYSMNNEQGFLMEIYGEPYRRVKTVNGLQFIVIDGEEKADGTGTSAREVMGEE